MRWNTVAGFTVIALAAAVPGGLGGELELDEDEAPASGAEELLDDDEPLERVPSRDDEAPVDIELPEEAPATRGEPPDEELEAAAPEESFVPGDPAVPPDDVFDAEAPFDSAPEGSPHPVVAAIPRTMILRIVTATDADFECCMPIGWAVAPGTAFRHFSRLS